MTCAVRVATVADAGRLAAFGHRVFSATFAPGNDPVELARYVDGAYNPDAQAAELASPAITTLLACDADDRLLGFAQLRRGSTPGSVAGEAPIELWRFYVDQDWHGRGVAAGLMAAVCDKAVSEGAQTLWLGVWERNPRAQAFYRKQGFAAVGTQVFMFGTEPQTDQIWVRSLQ